MECSSCWIWLLFQCLCSTAVIANPEWNEDPGFGSGGSDSLLWLKRANLESDPPGKSILFHLFSQGAWFWINPWRKDPQFLWSPKENLKRLTSVPGFWSLQPIGSSKVSEKISTPLRPHTTFTHIDGHIWQHSDTVESTTLVRHKSPRKWSVPALAALWIIYLVRSHKMYNSISA